MRALNLRGRAQGLLVWSESGRLPPSRLLVGCEGKLNLLIFHRFGGSEQFSITSPEARSDLMHIQGSYFGKLFGFFCGLLGTEVAVGPLDRLMFRRGPTTCFQLAMMIPHEGPFRL